MDDAVENARMREFIEAKGLTAEYDAYVAEYDKRRRELSEPWLSVQYDKSYSRSSRNDDMNITPWLKEAAREDVLRLVALAGIENDERSDDDNNFLKGVVEHCADEEERNWLFRAHDVTVWLYQFLEDFKGKLGNIRPHDRDDILAAIAAAEEAARVRDIAA